jgi:hypothetical protein
MEAGQSIGVQWSRPRRAAGDRRISMECRERVESVASQISGAVTRFGKDLRIIAVAVFGED